MRAIRTHAKPGGCGCKLPRYLDQPESRRAQLSQRVKLSRRVKLNTESLTEPSLEGHRSGNRSSWRRTVLDVIFPPVDEDPYRGLATYRARCGEEEKRRADRARAIDAREQTEEVD